jgi:hypothetical protein
MHRSRFPLKEWFWAAYLVATHTPGMSATQLRRQMGCSYKTAWFLLQRLRRGMVNKISQGAPIGAGCGGLNCAKRR